MLRTIFSREVAALAYLAFGVAALVSPVWSLRLGLPLFTGVQGLWWANSLADTRRLHQHDLEDTPAPADMP